MSAGQDFASIRSLGTVHLEAQTRELYLAAVTIKRFLSTSVLQTQSWRRRNLRSSGHMHTVMTH
jgi:hypothetical protein